MLERQPEYSSSKTQIIEELLRKEEHLDSKQLARRWNMSHRTLDRWRWQGKGPRFIKIGGRVVYRIKDIEEYENARLHSNTVYGGRA